MIYHDIYNLIQQAVASLGLGSVDFTLEHPADLNRGDYATNVAMVAAKSAGKNPRDLAVEIFQELEKNKPKSVRSIEIAGPGFINITLVPDFFPQSIAHLVDQGDDFGKSTLLKGKKIMTEFTDPNPFKLLHIGHLMTNTIGESLSRLFEFCGGDVRWSNYQGDVGMHVAKAIWGIIDLGGLEKAQEYASLHDQVAFLGKAYAHGATTFKNEEHVEGMKTLNKKIYERSDDAVNELYDWGREVSLAYFEEQYRRLGTYHNVKENKAFDFYNFESEVAGPGAEVVKENIGKVFEESEGAVVFDGEKYGLHKRVFINSLGLPTYEAKELALAKVKYDQFPYDLSYIITANEITEYFKVLLKAMSFVFPKLAEKTTHIGHGMMKLTTGKMSSRTGDVVAAEDLLDNLEEGLSEKVADEALRSDVAVAALKFAILKQDTSKDIVFDPEQSLSFEGDSGPYLQYTYARIQSVLAKAKEEGFQVEYEKKSREVHVLEKLLYRFPEVVEKSLTTHAPHYIAQYMLEIAHSFNSWYGNTKLIDPENPHMPYNLTLAKAAGQVIKNGLWVLGIEAPERM